jgi:hypothetical protein
VFIEANFTQYIFRLRVRMETVQDEQRVKCTIASMRKVKPTS